MTKKFLLCLMVLLSVCATAQEFKSPVDYLSYLAKEQQNIAKSTWKYTSAVAHSNSARRIDATRKQLIKTIQTSSKKIEALKNGYKGDVEFRDKLLTYFYFAEKNISEEYDKIINMQEVAEQSYDFMEAYIKARDMVNAKLDEEYEKVRLAQQDFALKYKIKLSEEESELGKKIKKSGEVFDYHTVLYLIFFKTNITDAQLSAAIDKKDMAAISQLASSLDMYADEGLEKLKSIQPYDKDASMISETKKAMLHYKKVAQEYIPKALNFIMLKDDFERTKTSIESKSAADRSKEEIDNFNAMVKTINKEIGVYNKVMSEYTNQGNAMINSWNAVGDAFISNHVPQD